MEHYNKYDYKDIYSEDVRITQPICALSLLERFFSVPKWIMILMKFRNAMMKPFGLKGESNLSDLVNLESWNTATIIKNDKHLYLKITLLTRTGDESQRIYVSTRVRLNNRMGKSILL